MPKETYIPSLMQLFRQHGYDGATLSKISAATGLGKASLYHHFPGGKDEMVASVLASVEDWFTQELLPALAGAGDAETKLRRMCDRLNELYESGRQPCLSAILLSGSARDVFRETVQSLYKNWILAIATVLEEAGMDAPMAKQRGETALILIQGSLVVSQGLGSPEPFQRVLEQLPAQLCHEGQAMPLS